MRSSTFRLRTFLHSTRDVHPSAALIGVRPQPGLHALLSTSLNDGSVCFCPCSTSLTSVAFNHCTGCLHAWAPFIDPRTNVDGQEASPRSHCRSVVLKNDKSTEGVKRHLHCRYTCSIAHAVDIEGAAR